MPGVHMSAATSPNSSQWTFRDKGKKCRMLSYMCLETFGGPFYIKALLHRLFVDSSSICIHLLPFYELQSMTPGSVTTAQLQCLEKGGPFEIVHVPKPSLSPDQVLIQQRVVALNGLDWKQRDFGILVSRWPHVLGIEGAGVVEAVGSEVKSLRVGD
jgi:hypothetical protein